MCFNIIYKKYINTCIKNNYNNTLNHKYKKKYNKKILNHHKNIEEPIQNGIKYNKKAYIPKIKHHKMKTFDFK